MRAWALVGMVVAVGGCTGEPEKPEGNAPAGDDTGTTTAGDTEEPPTDTDTDTDTDTGTDTGTTDDGDADGDGVPAELDCDDSDPDVYPGAPDVCGDRRVTDCDRTSDEGLVTVDGIGYTDLALALDAAPDGAEVLVCPGTYVGSFVAPRPVRLRALEDPYVTALAGDGTGPTLVLPGDSRIEGFTVRDGVGDVGGGLVQSTAGRLEVDNCLINGNTAAYGGGVALAEGGTAEFVHAVIAANHATAEGGGIWIPFGATAQFDLTGVVQNTAEVAGGGVSVQGGNVVYGYFAYNECAGDGGGLALQGGSFLLNAVVSGNTAARGAGLVIRDDALLEVASIYANAAIGAESEGGGILCDGCWLELVDSELLGNTAEARGGNLAVRGGNVVGWSYLEGGTAALGGGIFAEASALTDLSVAANQATTGGGLYATGAGNVAVEVGLFSANQADHGGAVAVADGDLTLGSCSVEENVANVGGGGVAVLDGGALTVDTVDFGVGGAANDPDDVLAGETSYAGYGPDASFACDGSGCLPAP